MKWKKVYEEIPPLNKPIIIGEIEYRVHKNELNWHKATVIRLYDNNKYYNSYLYKVSYLNENEYKILKPYDYWLDIDIPNDI